MAKNSQHKKAMKRIKAQRGLDRQDFYENGGEACRYRGLRLVQENKIKKKNKQACRGRVEVPRWM
jgi:hypothetical protein